MEFYLVEIGQFVLENSEGHNKFIDFSSICIGDTVVANEDVDEFRAGELYTVTGCRSTGSLIVDNVGIIRFTDYFRYFSVINQTVAKHIKPQDYLTIADFALDTKDEEWFNELHEKAKRAILV